MKNQAKKRQTVAGIEAAIFDLDGTILDSMGIWEKIDEDFLNENGFEPTDEYLNEICTRSFFGAAQYTIETFNLKTTPQELMDKWNSMALYEYAHNIRLKDGAKEYLEELRSGGIRLAVATSLPEKLYAPVLKNNSIYDFFEIKCSVDDVKRGKEFPDIFEYAIKKLGLAANQCIVFEDLFQAISSAKKIGAKTCGVYDKRAQPFQTKIIETADYYIKDYSLPPLLAKNYS